MFSVVNVHFNTLEHWKNVISIAQMVLLIALMVSLSVKIFQTTSSHYNQESTHTVLNLIFFCKSRVIVDFLCRNQLKQQFNPTGFKSLSKNTALKSVNI